MLHFLLAEALGGAEREKVLEAGLKVEGDIESRTQMLMKLALGRGESPRKWQLLREAVELAGDLRAAALAQLCLPNGR